MVTGSRGADGRMLLVEDNPGDRDLVREYLDDLGGARPSLDTATTLAEALDRLGGGGYDAVLLDLHLPDSAGLTTLDRVIDEAGEVPVIVLTGAGSADLGVTAVARGAADFLPKDELSGPLLLRSVRYSMERGRRAMVEARYRALVEKSRDLVAILDRDLSVRYVSPSVEAILGYRPEELAGAGGRLDVHPDDRSAVHRESKRILADPGHTSRFHYRVRHRDGSWRVLDAIVQGSFDDPYIRGFVINARDVTELRAAEAAALETARRLDRTLEALEYAVFTLRTPDRTILSCNRAAEQMFGRSADELVGASSRVLYPDDRSFRRFDEESVPVLRRGAAFRTEYRMQRADGTTFPVDVSVAPLDPEAGVESGVVSVVRDISERVERERQMRFQAALLQQVGQPIFAMDEARRITYWNRAAERLTGWSREEVEGRSVAGLLDAGGDALARAQAAAWTDTDWEGELHLRKRGGGHVVVRVTETPAVKPGGAPGGRIAVGVDITELRRAEAETRRAAERVRFQADMLEAVGQAVIATDLGGRITYFNRAAEELYGWSRNTVLGHRVLDIAPGGENRANIAAIVEALRAGSTWTGELTVRRRDGVRFPVLATAAPILDTDGRLMGVVGVSSDLTDRKNLEEQLRQAQKMEAVGRLAGGVAHDFNNLLTAVEGHAAMLLDGLAGDSTLRADAEEILAAGRRAGDLTRQLLAFSRRQVLEERKVDLGEVAGELENMLRRLVPERIEFRVHGAGPAVMS
ncbi:MAG: PAS domain S-box protein, partial [Gemmatimonadota bacterium]